MQRLALTVLTTGLMGAAACGAGIRPAYSPMPNARVDSVNAQPAAVIQEIAARMGAENIGLQWSSPDEGYLESQWYNIVTRESGVTSRSNPEQVILMRFWADPIGPDKARITSEVVIKGTTDPSVPPREQEIMAPPGHAGHQFLDRVLSGVIQRFGQ